MKLISDNEHGRVYIDNFILCNVVYKYIQESLPKLACYSVKYIQGTVEIYVKQQSDFNADSLLELQNKVKKLLEKKLGIYIEKVNIIIG